MNHILKTVPKAFPVTFSFDTISIVPISEKINSILYFFCDFVSFLQFTHCFFCEIRTIYFLLQHKRVRQADSCAPERCRSRLISF